MAGMTTAKAHEYFGCHSAPAACSHTAPCSTALQHKQRGRRRIWQLPTHATTPNAPSNWGLPQPGLSLKRPTLPSPEQIELLRQRPMAEQAPSQPIPAPLKPTAQHSAVQQRKGSPDASGAAQAVPTCILAVDYGTRWTGLALGKNGTAQELQTLKVDSNNRGQFARSIVELACKHQAQGIVVGLPLDPHNPRSTLSDPAHDSRHGGRCRHMAHAVAMLAQPQGIQVFLYDEAGTSGDALRIAGFTGHASMSGPRTTREKLDKKMDSLAAALLARRFMDKPGAAVRVRVRSKA